MINLYKVYYQDKLIGLYRAYSSEDAIEQAYMKTGSASAYTGKARRLYHAYKT